MGEEGTDGKEERGKRVRADGEEGGSKEEVGEVNIMRNLTVYFADYLNICNLGEPPYYFER